MKSVMKRITALLSGLLMIVCMSATAHAEEGYTYNYDWWGDVQFSPDAYSIVGVYTASDLGLDLKLSSPSGMSVYNQMVYICDTGNNRIIELERVNTDTLAVSRIIDKFSGEVEKTSLLGPTDVAVTKEGYIYICDKGNNRILKLDMELNYIMEFTKPEDPNFDQSLSFLPHKISVDTAGRVYCVATNVNKGLIKFESNGVFSGFVGATPVTYDFMDYVWKKLSTKEQRAQLESFVPTEYDNLYIDHEGFVYVCTTNVSEADLDEGTANPIRKLNMMGDDILVRNGVWYIVGDLYFGGAGGYKGSSLLTDITVLDNDTYVALDKTRGRLFAYDDQGRILFIFGGGGNMDGYFKAPVAIDHMDRDLLVLDSLDASITIFTPSHFGSLIYQAMEEFQRGEYEASGKTWQEVMNLNGNYDLAYIGIGRSLLRQERYGEAMEYFKVKLDQENYSRAFKQYRKEWVEEHIVLIFAGLFLVLCVPMIIGKIKSIKHEIDIADIFRYENKNEQ